MNPSLGSLDIDLPKLLETRLLIQASSGGGKSWALRRLLEQTAKQVQQIVIDPEGEFSTLREKFDYIICAPYGADAVATPATAAGLARASRFADAQRRARHSDRVGAASGRLHARTVVHPDRL